MERRTWFAAAVMLFVGVAAGPSYSASRFFDAKTMMPASEIQRGMIGVGRTVFQGTQISEFHVEVLGVLDQLNLGHEIILVRITDSVVVQRQTGVIGGMSGSPVYINGRLIGAVAYGYSPFPREPICGITCIDSMLEGLETGPETKTSSWPGPGTRYAMREPVTIGGLPITGAAVARPGDTRALADAATINLRPAAPLMYCSGLSKGAMTRLKKTLGPYGIEPLAGPGSKKDPVPAELVPGAAIAVRLMSGDFDAAGIGTVTYRNGDKLLAFGHPMMQMGQVSMPIATAWIYDVIPSMQRTNKMGSAMQTVGALNMDCPWSIGGLVGGKAEMVPVDIRVVDETRGITRHFHVDVTNEKSLTAEFAVAGASSAIESTFNTTDAGVANYKFTVEGDKGDSVTREDKVYQTGAPAQASLSDVVDSLQLLLDNRFKPQKIKRISVETRLNNKHDAALIEKVYAEESVAKAGEKLTLHVVLHPEGKDRVEKVLQLKLPWDLPKGNMRVGISGGSEAWGMRGRLGLLMPQFQSLQDVIKQFEVQESGMQLFAAAALPTTGLSVGGQRLMHLPAAIDTIIAQSPRTDMTRGKSELSTKMDTDWVVLGREVFTIATANREGAKGAPVAPPAGKEETKEAAAPPTPAGGMATVATQEELGHPMAPAGVPAGLWWAASAFIAPTVRGDADADAVDALAGTPPTSPAPPPAERVRRPRPTPPVVKPAATGAAAKATDDADEAKLEKPADKGKEDKGPVSRQVQVWKQSFKDDFQSGEADGVAVVSDGSLVLSPQWNEVARADQLYIWSVAASKTGDVYVGAGSTGKVFKVTDGKLAPFFDTGEFAVHALSVDDQGAVWAGTASEGKVFRIAPDGQGKLVCKVPTSYIWALCSDGKGGYYAGTGPQGTVYQISPNGVCKPIVATSQAHVTSLAMCGGKLYAGTSEKGLVFRVNGERQFEAVLDVGEANITALATDGTDRLFAATAPKGAIYEIKPDGTSEKVYDNDKQAIMSLAFDRGTLYAGTGDEGHIVALMGRERTAVLHDDKHASFITCLCSDGKGGMFAGTANPGIVLVARNDKPAEGEFKSGVLDAKRVSKWGIVNWQADIPDGASLKVYTRSGNSTDPDDGSWSNWSRRYERPGQDTVDSPAARFLQYKLTFGKPAGPAAPVLKQVSVAYLPANQKPTVSFSAPDENQAFRKEYEIKWRMSDPDKDTLLATLLWQKSGVKDWLVLKADVTAESFKWDTSKVPDGVYRLRVAVTDAVCNPVGALTAETDPRLVIVENAVPDVRIDDPPTQLEAGKSITVAGRALDTLSRITGVEWRYEGQDQWRGAAPTDGMFDSLYEAFTFVTGTMPKDVKAIIVRAHNAAGGFADVRIPAQKEEPTTPAPKAEPAKPADAKD